MNRVFKRPQSPIRPGKARAQLGDGVVNKFVRIASRLTSKSVWQSYY
jgi:hypothetical protein